MTWNEALKAYDEHFRVLAWSEAKEEWFEVIDFYDWSIRDLDSTTFKIAEGEDEKII